MTRAKVVVHMYVSIDGKIDGPYSSEVSGQYYSDEIFKMSNANASGRKTAQMYMAQEKVDLDKYDGSQLEYEDWIPEYDHPKMWQLVFDRKGKCGWKENSWIYNNERLYAVEIVSRSASKNYLAYLRSKNIPYIVSGDENIDFEEVLTKLMEKLGIETIALTGGAIINGAFLKAHLVDEISLVVSPFVSGDESQKGPLDTLGQFVDDSFGIKEVKKLDDGGVHLVFAKQ